MRSPRAVGGLPCRDLGVPNDRGDGSGIENCGVDHEPGAKPALRASRELPPLEGQVPRALDANVAPLRAKRLGDGFENRDLRGVDVLVFGLCVGGEDHGDVQRPRSDQNRAAAAGSPADFNPIGAAKRDVNVVVQPSRGSKHDRQALGFPDSEDRSEGRIGLGFEEKGFVEGEIRGKVGIRPIEISVDGGDGGIRGGRGPLRPLFEAIQSSIIPS